MFSFDLKINVEKQGSRASSNVLTCGRKVYYYLLLVNLAESKCLKIIGHVNEGWTVLFARNYWSWDRSQPHPWRKLTKADIRQVFWRTPYSQEKLKDFVWELAKTFWIFLNTNFFKVSSLVSFVFFSSKRDSGRCILMVQRVLKWSGTSQQDPVLWNSHNPETSGCFHMWLWIF